MYTNIKMDVYAYYYRMSSTKTEGALNVYGKPYQNLSIIIHIAQMYPMRFLCLLGGLCYTC